MSTAHDNELASLGRRRGVRGPIRRVRALLAVNAVVEWRYRIPLLIAGLAVAWSAVAAALPSAAPYLVFVETVTVATFMIGALTVAERAGGVRAALAVSPARPAEYVVARVLPLGVLTVLAAVPVLLAGGSGAGGLGAALGSVLLTTVLLLAVALGVAIRRRTLVGFLTAVPWPLLPLLGVPLAAAVGLLRGPVWYIVPTTGTLALLRDAVGTPGASPTAAFPAPALLAYLGVWVGLAAWFAARAAARPEAGQPGRSRTRRPSPRGARWEAGLPQLSFVRADLHNVVRDSMLAPIALSPLLLGVVLRFGYPPLEEWLARTHGFELAAYRPVVALLAIVLHVPVTAGMIGAVFVLDDIEDGVLRVVRVSPLGPARYLAYRLGAITVGAAIGLGVATPLSGLVPVSAWAAIVLAAPLAPVLTLSVLAVARGRVDGIVAVKPLTLAMYLPIAVWWVTPPGSWFAAPLPAFWAVWAWDAPRAVSLAGGVICSGLWIVLLTRRVARRLGTW